MSYQPPVPIIMLERRKPLDLLFPLKGGAANNNGSHDSNRISALD